MKRRQLSDEVASHLRQAIMAGELLPGQSVRAEAVGALLDVSATPVREALHALRVEGFLDLAPRRGFTVSPLDGKDIRDIFEAHALIAGELASRAAGKVTDEQISEIFEIHESLMEAVVKGRHEEIEQLNHAFHRAVYIAADSERLRWSLNGFAKYVPRAFYPQIDGWPDATAEDHGEIFEAIQERDAARARELMAQHIRNAGERLALYVDKRQVGKE